MLDQIGETEVEAEEEGEDPEEEGAEAVACLNNLTIETAGRRKRQRKG